MRRGLRRHRPVFLAGRDLRYPTRTGGTRMHVHALTWIVLAAIILTMIVVDMVGQVCTPHEPTLK